MFLLAVGPAIGAAAMAGPWIGPDPTLALPLSRAARVAWACAASGTILAVVGLAPLPIYVSLYALGAFAPSELAWPALLQAAAIAVALLVGIAILLAWRKGREPRRWNP